MPSVKEEALAQKPKTEVKNVADLPEVATDLDVKLFEGMNSETGEAYSYKYIEVNGERYRIAWKVLGDLKIILEENPNLKKFKVKKTGEGRATRYTVIPLS